jgi:hypothetical protein
VDVSKVGAAGALVRRLAAKGALEDGVLTAGVVTEGVAEEFGAWRWDVVAIVVNPASLVKSLFCSMGVLLLLMAIASSVLPLRVLLVIVGLPDSIQTSYPPGFGLMMVTPDTTARSSLKIVMF